MKKSEFKNIIKESVKEVLEENFDSLMESWMQTKKEDDSEEKNLKENDSNSSTASSSIKEEKSSNTQKNETPVTETGDFAKLKNDNPALAGILKEVEEANKGGSEDNNPSEMLKKKFDQVNESDKSQETENTDQKSGLQNTFNRDYSQLMSKLNEKHGA